MDDEEEEELHDYDDDDDDGYAEVDDFARRPGSNGATAVGAWGWQESSSSRRWNSQRGMLINCRHVADTQMTPQRRSLVFRRARLRRRAHSTRCSPPFLPPAAARRPTRSASSTRSPSS